MDMEKLAQEQVNQMYKINKKVKPDIAKLAQEQVRQMYPEMKSVDVIIPPKESIEVKKHFLKFEDVNQHEMIKESDHFLVDPDLFKGQFQTDSDLCGYLALAAQMQMGMMDKTEAETAKKAISSYGLKTMAENLRRQVGSNRLDTHSAEREIKDRIDAKPIIGGSGLKDAGFWRPGENIGEAIANAIDEGEMLPSIILAGLDHMVLGIGVSEDKNEIIAWDAKMGTGDPKLRRIPVDSPMLERMNSGMAIAVKVNPVFVQ